MRNFFSVVFLSILFLGCKSAMSVKENNLYVTTTALESNASVVVFKEGVNIPDSIKRVKIGDFKIRDGGMSVDCGYETVINIAKDKSRSVGGNVVKITNHKLPGFSTCHQIDFEVYKIDDVTPFEKEILWSDNRTLNWDDFKDAPKLSYPFYTCLYIDAYFDFTKFLSNKGRFVVETEFNTECSWVQPDYRTNKGLDLVNIHFDLTEIYSIKLRESFKEKQVDDYNNWVKYASDAYNEINKAYETEVYNLYTQTAFGNNEAELIAWKFKINEELKKASNQ
jgi:hypothetical protein